MNLDLINLVRLDGNELQAPTILYLPSAGLQGWVSHGVGG